MEKLPSNDTGATLTREKWLLILFQELGYGRLTYGKGFEIEGKSYPISHTWGNSPIHLVGCRIDIDRRTSGVAGASKMSPHSLVQEFLNRSKEHLWAFVSNGLILRILRDNVSLTRQAYVEFDLQGMMEGQIYSDFALLWLLCHQSRVENEKPEECFLEKWSRTAHEQGTRALEQLRKGVEDAITALGRGFIQHRGNVSLRENLKEGTLSGQDYYRQLLRLVYRLLFLFVAEDRNLLLLPDGNIPAKEIYTKFYSTARLRTLAGKRKGTKHIDLYRGLKVVMNKLSYKGCQELALPALGSYLWSEDTIMDLHKCDISNSELLNAVRHLSYTVDKNTRRAVDYKNLGSEELGSIYESLLELHPRLNTDTGEFSLETAGGSERKTTGSYYTPSSLINCLLDSALDPVIDEAIKKEDPEKEILELKVCDPACGSGHFLIAAAYRMAKRLAAVRTGNDEPAPESVRKALRDVIGRCIYGVDLNEMAVELCKVNLWMEALEPGKPLSFLDHHVKCGNSLVGLDTMERLKDGIPDDAFKPVTGDDKTVASRIKALNKRQRKESQSGQMLMLLDEGEGVKNTFGHIAGEMRLVNSLEENSTEDVKKKEDSYKKILSGPQWWDNWTAANIWTSAFFYPLKDENDPAIATHERLMRFIERPSAVDARLPGNANAMAIRNNFFHWPLEFPVVYEAGGFDVVLGNPPWEKIKLQEKEFFATRNEEIATAPNKAARDKLIKGLRETNPALLEEFEGAKHIAEAQSKFVRTSGRFPLTAVGDVNTYALFAELARKLLNERGRAGIIVPTGIATDDTCKKFFGDLNKNKSLVSLYDFENREKIFPAVDSRYKFCLFSISGKSVKETGFSFFLTNTSQLEDKLKIFTLSPEDISLINPNTQTTPIFRTKIDADLTRKIYRKVTVLINEKTGENSWGISFMRMFDMSNDSHLFFTEPAEDRLPLYEAKMIWQFDHRFGTYENVSKESVSTQLPIPSNEQYTNPRFIIKPRYFVNKIEVEKRLEAWNKGWLIGFRDITNATNERTSIFSLFPRVCVGNKAPIIFFNTGINIRVIASFLANVNSIVFDYVARQKIGGTSLNYFIAKQLPVLPHSSYTENDISFITPRVLELVYTAYDMKLFAEDMNYQREPFIWDEDRRALLRAELDAYYAKLYGLTRDELRYILDPHDIYGPDFPGETFRVLKEKEIKKYGEYRTRRLVLEAWDRMEEAGWDSSVTALDPPPADPGVVHKI
ncbi:restriction endonuclease [Candidatus Parcubacteria bacterium]|nr:MAG: restriction endonuclease [Candidatus Parcubacteria bacterium]